MTDASVLVGYVLIFAVAVVIGHLLYGRSHR